MAVLQYDCINLPVISRGEPGIGNRWDGPIANGNDHVQIVVIDLSSNLSPPFQLNYCKICNGSSRGELTFLEDVLHMFENARFISLEQVCHLRQRQPNGVVLESDFDSCDAVFGLVENDLGFWLIPVHG